MNNPAQPPRPDPVYHKVIFPALLALDGDEGRRAAKRDGFSISDQCDFTRLQAALERIAETAAAAGNDDSADWSDVYAAMKDVHVLVAEIQR